MTQSQDQIARRAAELLRDGLAGDIQEAVDQARRAAGGLTGPPPGRDQVRRHLEAMQMSRAGWTGWHADRLERLQELEQFLATMEHFLDPLEIRVAGRAAKGELDEGDRIHIRIWIDGDLSELASVLETAGLGPSVAGSRPVKRTKANGLSRLATLDFDMEHLQVQLSLCPPRELVTLECNLVSGGPIELASPDDIRKLIEQVPRDSDHAG